MTDPGSPEFPTAKDDDDDDVAWALSTAQVQWKRGSQADAVVWLRRAIDSAVSVGATWRAAELTRETDTLEAWVVSGPAAAPAAMQGEVQVDDFDGTDMIDEEAMSLPPDDDIDALVASPLHADATDERTDVTSEDDQPGREADDAAVEGEADTGEDEVVEIDEDDISDDDLSDQELPRFASEAPTANFAAPELDEDPSPTPVRLSVADAVPPAYQNTPERLAYEIEPEPSLSPNLNLSPSLNLSLSPSLNLSLSPSLNLSLSPSLNLSLSPSLNLNLNLNPLPLPLPLPLASLNRFRLPS